MGCSARTVNHGESDLPQRVRVSLGSAIILGLLEGKLDAKPTTVYLMTYNADKCTANCGFCPQARSSLSKAELLSRVAWPIFSVSSVLRSIGSAANGKQAKHVCIQALNYPEVFAHLVAIVKAIKQRVDVTVSVSCQPLNSENIQRLATAGVDRIGIALDAATERLFDKVKGSTAGGPYRWASQFRQLRKAVEVFGEGKVTTHLIIGLGETEKEAVRIVQKCVDLYILPALFAFTPVNGTVLENKPQPAIDVYRRVQLARYLIVEGLARYESMRFDAFNRIVDFNVKNGVLMRVLEGGEPFLTSGCPDCNRPFYNEKPSGPIYNYPRSLSLEEVAAVRQQLGFSFETLSGEVTVI